MKRSVFLSIFLVIFPFLAWSSSYQDFVTSQICSRGELCSPSEQDFKDKKILQCQMDLEAHRCADLKKENPSWGPLMKSCDWSGICSELDDYGRNADRACLRGYKNALVDLGVAVKDLGVSLVGLIDSAWERVKKDHRERMVFLRECEKSLVCKRDLVKGDHRYNTLSDEELVKMSASFLYTEARSMSSWQSSLDRSRLPEYKPLSERGLKEDETEELSEEHREKLKSLMNIAQQKLKDQYDRYNCYTAVAQEELACYAIGTVFDPTLVAGYFVKGARVAKAASRLSKTADLTTTGARVSARQLRNRYAQYTPTSVEQNKAWIAKAELTNGRRVFMDVENSQMKHLNDTLNDKELVTSLTNYHKEILFSKVQALEAANPGLVVSKYSDFKSSRFAFEGTIPPDLDAQLTRLLRETNDEFAQSVAGIAGLEGVPGWFRGGVGSSADEANIAARYSRQTAENSLQSFSSKQVASNLEAKMLQLDRERTVLRTELASTSMVERNTFHEDVFDLVRKNPNPADLQAALKGRFALQELSSGTVERLQRYVHGVDEFSPGIHIAQREFANLSAAPQGGMSGDIIGLGGANLRATADALSESGNLSEALLKTRRAEKEVTREFLEQKNFYEEAVRRSVGADKMRTICSGDDCVSLAQAPLTSREKEKIVQEFANSKYSGRYRLSFVSDGVQDPQARTMLSVHGESMEKVLRSSLSSSIEPNKLRGLTFGIDLTTKDLNQGPVRLIIGQSENLRLTARERALIDERFKRAVESFNSSNNASYRVDK